MRSPLVLLALSVAFLPTLAFPSEIDLLASYPNAWEYHEDTPGDNPFQLGSDGQLICSSGVGEGVLLTRKSFADFTVSLEWRIAKGSTNPKLGSALLIRTEPTDTTSGN